MFKRIRIIPVIISVALTICSITYGQVGSSVIRASVKDHFTGYINEVDTTPVRVERVDISTRGRHIEVYLNPQFSYQLFRHEMVDSIYHNLRQDLPDEVKRYDISIYSNSLLYNLKCVLIFNIQKKYLKTMMVLELDNSGE